MDIDLAIEAEHHARLKNDLHALLFENRECKSLHCYPYACSLGKWLYGSGILHCDKVPEIHALERTHAELHQKIMDLADKKAYAKKEELLASYKEVEVTSDRLGVLIRDLKEKINKTDSTEINSVFCDESQKYNNSLLDLNADLVKEHQTLYDFFMQAPGLFCVLKGPSHIFQLVNPYYKQIIGNRDLNGKEIRAAMPELKGQGVFELLDKVYQKQKTYTGTEISIYFDKGKGIPEKSYVNFIYKPIVNRKNETEGILVFGYDVSEQVYLRKQSEESEARLKLAIDVSDMGSFEWNMNTSEFIYSERLAKIFGYKRKTKITHNEFVKAIHPEDKKIRIHAIEEALRTGLLFYEARIIRPDGHIRWLKFSGRILFDRKHNPQKMYGTALDVTDQKTLEERLEKKVSERTKELILKNELLIRQKELSENVINSSIDNIAVFDKKLRYVILNSQALKSYKKKPENIIGKQVNKVFPQLVKSGLYRDLKKALKGEAINNFNYSLSIMKGYFETSLLPLKDSNNEVYGVLMIAHDNTLIIEASERLIAANKKLEEKNTVLEKNNKELESFRYIANHDLQEPLRKIQVFTGMIKKNIHNESRVKEYIENINNSSQVMSHLIQAVLNYSKLTRTNEKFVSVNLNTIMSEVKKELQPLLNEKNGQIKNKKLLSVQGSPEQLKELFLCLINNGLKFSNKKPLISISSKIIITNGHEVKNASKIDKYVELIFKDNGIGFEQKYADQIFKMFKRLQTSQLYPGAGIGLALVKKIVENHKGQIFVKSEPLKGTAFYIYLPVL
jgi:PAS domain S-box-containing protein